MHGCAIYVQSPNQLENTYVRWCTGLNENTKGDVDGDGTADLWRVTYHKQLKGVTAITKVTWGAKRHLLAVAETVPNSSKVRRVHECAYVCMCVQSACLPYSGRRFHTSLATCCHRCKNEPTSNPSPYSAST